MKRILQRYLITAIVGTLSLGLLLASLVQAEKPAEKKSSPKEKPPVEKKEDPAPERRSLPRPKTPPEERANPHHGRPAPGPAVHTTTFLGVAATEVPPAVRAHLELPRGVGISVGEVMPESPAAKAGIKAHDVLTRLDDQILVTPEQFQILVRMKEPGDKIKLTSLRAGKERTLDITLGQHQFPVAEHSFHRGPGTMDRPGDARWDRLERDWSEKMRQWWEANGDEISDQFRQAMREAFDSADDLGPRFKNWLDDLDHPDRPDRTERFNPHRDRQDREPREPRVQEHPEDDKDPI